MIRFLRRAAVWLIVLYAIYVSALVWLHPYLLYQFDKVPYEVPGWQHHVLDGADVPVSISFRKGRSDKPIILFFMGNAGNLRAFVPLLNVQMKTGATVVALNYRGGAGRPGIPSEDVLKSDALRAYDYVVRNIASTGQKVVLHGYSLGSGLAMHVASAREADGMVLTAPFFRLCEVMTAQSFAPACFVPGVQRWDNAAVMGKISMPTLVMHGTADTVIPFEQGQRLARRLSSAHFETFEGEGHWSLVCDPDYERALWSFLAQF
ncbi:MAG: alpha/beta fold hydrolase [Pseudomonadota bacterium]